MANVALKENFKQVTVWPGTLLEDMSAKDFEDWVEKTLGTRVQYLETVVTAPDMNGGETVEQTGGRHDVFFAVHNEDLGKFAVPRLSFGMRWLEDVYGNGGAYLYPKRIVGYMCWDGYQEQYGEMVTN
jgi:hypothetical protein